MNHWKKRLFTAAALVAALPLARGQSAPVAAPAASSTWSADSLPKDASADRAYLGVYPGTEAEGGGVKLEQVVDGSPAAKAGLQAGDVITAFGDRTVGNDEELRTAIASHQSGEKVKITFLREGEKRRTSARLGTAPSETDATGGDSETVKERVAAEAAHDVKASEEKAAKAAKLDKEKLARAEKEKAAKAAAKGGGMVEVAPAGEGGDNSGYMGVMLAAASDGRSSITSIVDGSPAQQAGFQAGDVILTINGEEASSVEELVELVKKHHAGEKITVAVERDGKPQKIKVKLGARSAANLGGGAGSGAMAAPTVVAPEPKAAEPAAPRAARARTRAPAATAAEGAGGDAAMRGEVNAMRAELEKLRKSMDELKVRCESQQRTIEKVRRALDGNEEPNVFSFSGTPGMPGADATTAVALPSELAAAGGGAVAVPDGGGVFQIEAAHGAKPIILHLEGSDEKVELEGLGEQIQAIVQKHQGGGNVLRVKPKVEGEAIELVLAGDEGGECCAGAIVGADGASMPHAIVVKGQGAKALKSVKVAPHGGIAHGSGTVLSLQPAGAAAGGMAGVAAPRGGGGGCCCCCQQSAVFHGDLAGHHSGAGMGGMAGTGTFQVLPPQPNASQRPMRARMHAVPGTPATPAAPHGPMKFQFKSPQAQSFAPFPGAGTTVWKCDGPCELTLSAAGAEFRCEGSVEISQTGDIAGFAGDTAEFEIEGVGDVDFEGETADLAIDAGSDDFGEQEGGAFLQFAAEGVEEESEDAEGVFEITTEGSCCEEDEGDCCEEEGSGCCEESDDGDDEDEHEDGDDDDDEGEDDDDSSAAASVAVPAI